MRRATWLLCCAAALPLSGCYTFGNDEGVRYLQRKDTVTLSAGDAKEVNARTHMLDPYPPGVGDRRIPMQGSRAVRAMDCYRQGAGKELVSDQRGRAPNQNNTAIGGAGGGATAGGGASQMKC